MKQKTFLVAGGDLRQLYTAKALTAYGSVYAMGFDTHVALPAEVHRFDAARLPRFLADYLILPMPCTIDGAQVHAPFSTQNLFLSGLPALLAPGGAVFGGRVCAATRAVFDAYSIPVTDYYAREELSVLNAVPTAEGALQLILEELPTTVFGLRCLVTGFGRISKVLCRILTAMGAQVTVAARKPEDRVWAELAGCRAVPVTALGDALGDAALVCNTVPALLFGEEQLRLLPPDALVIDLASKPGGVDLSAAGRLGIKTIWALALPGKTAPVSAGESIAHTIHNILKERGDCDD